MALSSLLRGLFALLLLFSFTQLAVAERVGIFVFEDDKPTTTVLAHHLRRMAEHVEAVVVPDVSEELQQALGEAASRLKLKLVQQEDVDPEAERVNVAVHEVPTMHIGELRVISSNAGGGRRRGRVLATIHDEEGSPISGVAVTGTFVGAFEEDVTALTGYNGRASLITGLAVRLSFNYSFCVTDVWHPEYVHDPTADVETCGQFSYVMPSERYYTPE